MEDYEEVDIVYPIEYDKCGRMKYNPGLHFAQFEPWNDEDLDYLINWYNIIGLEEMSLALGKTESKVINMVYKLRNKGLMKTVQDTRRKRQLRHVTSRTRVRKVKPEDIENILKLKITKTNKEIAEMYNVSVSVLIKRIAEYKSYPGQPASNPR